MVDPIVLGIGGVFLTNAVAWAIMIRWENNSKRDSAMATAERRVLYEQIVKGVKKELKDFKDEISAEVRRLGGK
tara:strand:+ start:248 stop:469 length:222 start_codon:yes stop_codon:yes gene_type:complete